MSASSGHSASSSDSEEVNTPLTKSSALFDDGDTELVVKCSSARGYILVVGGCGFIGSHTVWELAKAGYNVIVIDNLCNSFRVVFDRINKMVAQHYQADHRRPSLAFHEADFRDTKTMEAIFKTYEASPECEPLSRNDVTRQKSLITGVIHFAAYKAVGESIKQPLKYYSNNVCGLVDFCSLLGDFGIKNLVFSSSATVYGTVADMGVPLREEHCSQETSSFLCDDGKINWVESGCTGLTNPYGRTKWMCEAILSDLARADEEWNITALRYFNPIGCDESGLLGEDPRSAATNLMPVVLRVLNGHLPVLNIYGSDYDTIDGTAVRDYIHVTDLACGHLAALRSTSQGGFQVYNLGSGNGHSVLELVAAMEKVSGQKIQTKLVDRREGDVGTCVAKADKAEKELCWKTEKTLEDCCRDVWRSLERVQSLDHL